MPLALVPGPDALAHPADTVFVNLDTSGEVVSPGMPNILSDTVSVGFLDGGGAGDEVAGVAPVAEAAVETSAEAPVHYVPSREGDPAPSPVAGALVGLELAAGAIIAARCFYRFFTGK